MSGLFSQAPYCDAHSLWQSSRFHCFYSITLFTLSMSKLNLLNGIRINQLPVLPKGGSMGPSYVLQPCFSEKMQTFL
jgi:hypothetical protein